MREQEPADEYQISKNRVEALIDGIFAFAMTLLVVSLTVPELTKAQAAVELPARVAAMHSEFFTFFIAFFVLASFWLVHHKQFNIIRTVNPTVLWINIYILFFIVLLPFSTSIGGDYSDVQVAVVIFHANMFIIGALFFIHWYYISHHPYLLSSDLDQATASWNMHHALLVVPFVALTGIALSFMMPSNSMMVYLLIPVGLFIVRRFVCP